MREKELSEKVNHDPKHVKMAIGIASDPRHKGGDYTGAHNKIEKIAKGLASHPQVAAVLKKNNEAIKEGLGDEAHLAEQDHEVQMARAELYKLAKYAIKLHDMLKGISEREGLEGWVQSKITKSADMIGSVYHHLEYQESPMGEVTEAAEKAGDTCSCCDSKIDKAGKCGCDSSCSHCGGQHNVSEGKRALPERGSRAKKNKSYKESLAAKLENVQQQRKAVAEDLAPTKDQLKGKELDALRNKNVAKMDAEDKAARKAQADKFAAIKKSADNKGK